MVEGVHAESPLAGSRSLRWRRDEASSLRHRRFVFFLHLDPARFERLEFLDRLGALLGDGLAARRVLREQQRIGERLVAFGDLGVQVGDLVLGGLDLVLERLELAAALGMRRGARPPWRAPCPVRRAALGALSRPKQEAAVIVEIAVERLAPCRRPPAAAGPRSPRSGGGHG